MAGNQDANFCPLSYFSFNSNLAPEIYTGEFANNLRFHELTGETHWVSQGVADEMSLIDSDLSNFFALKNSAKDCGAKAEKEAKETKFLM